MIKVTVKDRYLNVRVGEPQLNAPSYQYIAPGSEIEVDGILYPGDSFEDNSMWLKDAANNYYWSGGVSGLPSHDHPASGKKTFTWFDQLRIADIWQTYQTRGANVKVAILDSGYRKTNPDLPKIKPKNTKVIIDSRYYTQASLVIDDVSKDGHGTRCASLIGAMNSREWLVGIAPDCELLIAKTSTNHEFYDHNYLINGIKWALSEGADIISASFAFDLTPPETPEDYARQIDALLTGNNRQVLLLAAAGNTKTPLKHDYFPAMLENFISIGAVTPNGKLSPITVINNKTVLHAPGEDIESYGTTNEPTPQSGTSFATPIVAGIAALAIGYLKQQGQNWNSQDLIAKMNATANPIPGQQNRKMINPTTLFKELKNEI